MGLVLRLPFCHIYYSKSKDNEVSQQRAEYERLQKQLQQRLLQVEEELAMEKQRMLSEKEDSLRTLEQEHRVKVWSHNGLVKNELP